MDIYENYDTTNMTPDDIMKLFKQAEWNEIKSVSKKKLPSINTSLSVFSNNDLVKESPNKKLDSPIEKQELIVFSKKDFTVESPNKAKIKEISAKHKKNKEISMKHQKDKFKNKIIESEIIQLSDYEGDAYQNKTISRPVNEIEKIKLKYCFDLHEYENQQQIKTDWNMWSTPNLINLPNIL
jgi:hypothetical protein